MGAPARLTVLVKRWHHGDLERLEVPDGKGWRLPYREEIGITGTAVDDLPGVDFEVFASEELHLDRMHRWVRIT